MARVDGDWVIYLGLDVLSHSNSFSIGNVNSRVICSKSIWTNPWPKIDMNSTEQIRVQATPTSLYISELEPTIQGVKWGHDFVIWRRGHGTSWIESILLSLPERSTSHEPMSRPGIIGWSRFVICDLRILNPIQRRWMFESMTHKHHWEVPSMQCPMSNVKCSCCLWDLLEIQQGMIDLRDLYHVVNESIVPESTEHCLILTFPKAWPENTTRCFLSILGMYWRTGRRALTGHAFCFEWI